MNQETFGWREAANHWSQGIDIQWSYIGEHSWKDFTDRKVTFYREGIVYRLRPEPIEPVKWARGAYSDGISWVITGRLYSSMEDFKEQCKDWGNIGKAIWPARFDSDGFLITPESHETFNLK